MILIEFQSSIKDEFLLPLLVAEKCLKESLIGM